MEKFPFVHSDETWLGGLSRFILQTGKLDETEPFFDLYKRSPHALRLIFQGIQMLFIKIFGYSVSTLRSISLLFACGSLYLVYRLMLVLEYSEIHAVLTSMILAAGVQFIYAGHFARQESIILFLHILSLYLFFKTVDAKKRKHDFFTGFCISAAVSVHPNSFVIFLPLVFLYLYRILVCKDKNFRNLLFFLIPVVCSAGFFLAISFFFDPSFIRNYFSYGSTLGVDNSLPVKIRGVYDYFYKLFFQISGTYYTPFIQVELMVLCLIGVAGIGFCIASCVSAKTSPKGKKTTNGQLALVLVSICAGIIFIGRYNQTHVILLFPSGIMLFTGIETLLFRRRLFSAGILGFVFLLSLFSSAVQIRPWIHANYYQTYLDNISRYVPNDAVVLANLNTEPYFIPGKFYDYRNLTYLPKKKDNFENYIEKRDIEYILVPGEMEFIFNSRPVWNIIYGNIWPYYENMQRFLQEKTVYIGDFTAPVYAMRIVRFQKKKPWKVKIYRVIE